MAITFEESGERVYAAMLKVFIGCCVFIMCISPLLPSLFLLPSSLIPKPYLTPPPFSLSPSFLPSSFPLPSLSVHSSFPSPFPLPSSLIPRPCVFFACSTKFCTNFVLKATNVQGFWNEATSPPHAHSSLPATYTTYVRS